MMLHTYQTIVEQLFVELDDLLNNYLFHSYTALAHYLRGPLGLAIVLYIIILGLAITQGWVQLSMQTLLKSTLKLGFIYLAAMHWDWFSHELVALINQSASETADVLENAAPIPIPHFAGEGINGGMQSILIEITKIGAWLWGRGSWHNSGPCITAILIWGFGYFMMLAALFELVLAKIMIAVLLACAPLFISFTLFKPTQGLFDRWLGVCAGFSLVMIFISAVLALTLSLCQWAIAETYASHALDMTLVGFVPMMIVGFVCACVILRVAGIALAIGGSITYISHSNSLATTLGGFIGAASALPLLKPSLTSRSGAQTKGADKAAIRQIHNSIIKAG